MEQEKYKEGDIIIINGASANNPIEDIGKCAKIVEICDDRIYYVPLENEELYEKEKWHPFYAYSKDCKKIDTKNNILFKKIEEGRKDELIQLGLLEKNGNLSKKGIEFISKFS